MMVFWARCACGRFALWRAARAAEGTGTDYRIMCWNRACRAVP